MVRTAEESKKINKLPPSNVIMASSGMCNAGRIKHHLKHNIEKPEATILFVGHQGEGTLGRQIVDGAKRVRIHGQDFQVRAKISQDLRLFGACRPRWADAVDQSLPAAAAPRLFDAR